MPGITTAFAQGLAASRPAAAASNAGFFYLATDTAGGTLYQSTGSAWVQLAASVSAGAGAAAWSWSTKSATYTITTADTGILVDTTSGALTITLPTAVGATQQYTIAKKTTDTNKVTLATTSSQTINGVATKKLSLQDDLIVLGSDGSNWWISRQSLGDVVQLDYALASDATTTPLTAATWTGVGANNSFTVDDAASLVEVAASGSALIGGSSVCQTATRIVIDSAGTPTTKPLGGGFVAVAAQYCNPFAGADTITLSGLSAGAHTVQVQVQSVSANNFYCRPATNPATEFLSVRVIERKR